MVTVRQHTASYDAADKTKDSSKRKGAGEELEKVKAKKALQKTDLFDGYDFSEEDFNEWYEGTGSASDKKVAKALRKTLGRKAYDELNDLAADNYKKGGASSFFKKNVKSSSPKNVKEKAVEAKASKSKTKHWSENVGHGNEGWTPEQQAIINYEEKHAGYPEFDKSHFGRASHKIDWMTKDSYESLEPKDWKSLHAAMLKDQKSSESKKSNGKTKTSKKSSESSSTTSTTGAGADWSKATVDKIGSEYGGGYTIVGTPNDGLWGSTNFKTKSQALDFIKRKQKESSATETGGKRPIDDPFKRARLIEVLRNKGKGEFDRVQMSHDFGEYFSRKGGWTPSAKGKELLKEAKREFDSLKTSKKKPKKPNKV